MTDQGAFSAGTTAIARARAFSGASWLLLSLVACADSDATPAFSYPFDPNVDEPRTVPGVITTLPPNQPDDGVTDRTELDEPGPGLDVPRGAGGLGGTGGIGAGGGGVGGFGPGGAGGFFGFMPDDTDDPEGEGLGGGAGVSVGVGGTGGATGGAP